jgi:steroid delta-isomerase-like uncharacterized protein
MTAILNQHIACVRSFIDQIWNAQNTASLSNFLVADYVDHAYTPPDAGGLLNILSEMRKAFPDAHQTIKAITAQDDMVVCRIVLSATHTGTFRASVATGNAILVNVYRSFRMQDGKIAEHWALLDTASLLRQIGSVASSNNACALTN